MCSRTAGILDLDAQEDDVCGAAQDCTAEFAAPKVHPLRPTSVRLNRANRNDRMKQTTWRADPLVWGHGPRVFEVFLEPTCPFSAKAFAKLDDLLAQAGEDRIAVKIRLQSQPWHMYSGVIVRCILAASTLQGGKEAAKAVMAAVAAHRQEFEFDHHCNGQNLDATPNDVANRRLQRCQTFPGLRDSRSGPGDQVALQIRPPERYPCVAELHDRRPGAG